MKKHMLLTKKSLRFSGNIRPSLSRKSKKRLSKKKIEAAVQERLNSEASSETSEETQTEEEVVEEAIENAEVEEEALANNNGSTTEESLSIREKFAKAFSEDNVTIQY